MTAFSLVDEPAGAVLDLTSPALSSELAQIEDRLHVLRGLLDAAGRLGEINKVVQFSGDRGSALVALQQAPFGYSRQQAEAILDMPIGAQAAEELGQLRNERDHLAERRAGLREHVAEVLALHWFG
ncbi:MAG: hypothetical protein ACRDZX_17830 [Acidimicrobiales bacterium]